MSELVCRICGHRLVYLRRTFTYRHATPVPDGHMPLPGR
jgi:hypothetical protein